MTTSERLRSAVVILATPHENETPELGEYGCLVGGQRKEATHHDNRRQFKILFAANLLFRTRRR